jgi:PEP-CTERM motif
MRMRVFLTVLFATAMAAGSATAARFQNGGFEDGFDGFAGWTMDPGLVQNPGVFVHRDENDLPTVFDPVSGFYMASLQADAADDPIMLSQTFDTVGGNFSGWVAFLGQDTQADFGFVRLLSGDVEVARLFDAGIAGLGAYNYTPWTKFSTTLGAGTYTIQAAVVNAGDGFNPSFLLLDDVRMTNVPEPAAWALMLVGFGASGTLIRRRRAQFVRAKA